MFSNVCLVKKKSSNNGTYAHVLYEEWDICCPTNHFVFDLICFSIIHFITSLGLKSHCVIRVKMGSPGKQ